MHAKLLMFDIWKKEHMLDGAFLSRVLMTAKKSTNYCGPKREYTKFLIRI